MDDDPGPDDPATAGEEGVEDLRDERIDWLRERVCSSLRVREEAFAALAAAADARWGGRRRKGGDGGGGTLFSATKKNSLSSPHSQKPPLPPPSTPK